LCLLSAREPVACSQGDLFCRECAISNLLAQRKEIARLEKEWERRKEDEKELKKIEDEQEKERAVQDFEKVQMGLSGAAKNKRKADDVVVDERDPKRKFELVEEMKRAEREERKKIRADLDAEKVRFMNSTFM
jgi:nitric oxide synthase-interacting protein